MATVTKDFRVKAGLVVEGSTATVDGHDVLTEGLVDAKGDLLVGSGADAVSRVALGTNGYILTADDNEATGVKWAAAPAVGTFASSVTFEGATADSYQTTLEVAEPTADRTITLPNATGTVALTSDITSAVDALDTDDIEEGTTNLYFSNQRALDATASAYDTTGTAQGLVDALDSDDIEEGATNLYFTNQRALDATSAAYDASGAAATAETNANSYTDTAINGLDTDDIEEGTTNLYFTNQRAIDAVGGTIGDQIDLLTTDDIEEGTTNKYFSTSLVDNHLSGGDGINYSLGTISAHLGNGLEIGAGGEIQIDDLVIATETDLSNAITAHDVASGVHGVTGSVVGTTDTQTLSNKTLGSALAAGGYKITNLGSPDNSTDAATKGYVDAVSEGLHIHEAARVAVDGNISIATGLENGDNAGGVTLATGDRVLLKSQTNTAENGIYVVQVSGQALRATDFDTATEVDSGDFVFVTSGTYANTGWVQTLKPATIGTDPLSFTQFSGAGTFTAGNGLTLNGTVFSIDDTITATKSYVDEELDAHIDLTDGVHGVTGDVVGTSDTQTLTSKTLGSGTVLGASIDAVNTYTIINLEEPTNNQDAATKGYVDTEITGVGTDLTTHQNATTGIHGVTGNIVGTTDSQTLENKTISYEDNTITVQVANVSDLTASATELNYVGGVTSSIQDQLDDKAPLDSPSLTTPNIGVATATSIAFADALLGSALATAGTSATTIDTWSATTYSSAKYLVQMKKGSDIEVIEVLVTVDGNNNVYLTEYADVISNTVLGTTNAVYSGGNVLLQVTGASSDTSVKVQKVYIEA
jgi:hypothetical protein